MLSQAIPQPPQLSIPKYLSDYPSHHVITRPKLATNPSFYQDIPHIVSVNGSPVGSPTDTIDDERIPSPSSPQATSGTCDYIPRNSNSFHSSVEIYRHSENQSYTTGSHHYTSAPDAQQSYDINNSATAREPEALNSYLSESPSTEDTHLSTTMPHPISAPHSQERFLHSEVAPYPGEDRNSRQTDSGAEQRSRDQELNKYTNTNSQNPLLDHRRMSEPAALSGPTLYATAVSDNSAGSRYQQFAFNPLHNPRSAASLYVSPLQRGASTGSLRDLRHHHFEYPPLQTEWKHREQHDFYDQGHGGGLDEPISPLQPNFSGGPVVDSPTAGMPYSPISENLYGPSPPGTGTSTSSSAPLSAGIDCSPSRSISQHLQRSLSTSHVSTDGIDRKTYSFVALPGNAVKKRPRRRYDEIERLYQCSWPDCNKSYGTLNHLNAHVTMQKHGSKRSPNEFKELRKQWRKAKKESEGASTGGMRRDSYSDGYDDNGGYDHRYLSSHSLHHRPHSSHLPSSVSIPHAGTTERYSVAVDEIRYVAHDRDDSLVNYASLAARQRYGGSQPSSWHGGSGLPSRPNLHQSYTPSSLPSHPAHHTQLPQLAINNRLSQASALSMPLNRLPQNSTLLTPLPGYHTPSLMPPLQAGCNGLTYTTETYEVYEDDNTSRPGTGHASIGHTSVDEFEHSH
ncbi:hypothetical protein B0H34DRAFT_796760 [Crassisporium funariophilum]|nr:hypothetical protein B0H34DRAFT_796760 [Crassisporium funariophilum]